MGLFRYFGAYLFIILGYLSISGSGLITFSVVLFSFVLIPSLELIIPEAKSVNHVKSTLVYDLILYSLVPLYLYLFLLFLNAVSQPISTIDLIGKITAMGILCGVFGINMAHELGHRKSKFDRFLAQGLLATTQYTHFFIEHNRGHHKRVGTPEDPATARKGESIYRFYFRVLPESYRSAWSLEKERLKRSNKSAWSLQNDMIKYAIIQLSIIAAVILIWSPIVAVYYGIASLIGILLLETIDYIEHYGLTRKKINTVAYERVQDVHSWNSDHLLGRYLLFELTRHSHHHENSLVKYPNLNRKEEASQLPTGYPGMMLLSFVPALWFRIMDARLPKE